jgi:alpha-beta hydrolase superfamily lysophospholipase
MSGRNRGDVEYIGQLEDDLSDLIQQLRSQNRNGPITLGGHSSGGGLAIRFAGGAHANAVTSYLLLAPIIPTSPAIKQGTAGGWANLHVRRLYGLLALNAIGIRGFNALPIVEFNKPPKFWDGTETLTCSYRLNASYHPRSNYKADIAALNDHVLALVGANDEAIDAQALHAVFASDAPRARVIIMPEISHFGIFTEPVAWNAISSWLQMLPPSASPKLK